MSVPLSLSSLRNLRLATHGYHRGCHRGLLAVGRVVLLSLFMGACAGQQNADIIATDVITNVVIADKAISDEAIIDESIDKPINECPIPDSNAADGLARGPSALTESLLSNLLIANFALSAEEYPLAGEAMAKAADESADVALIEKATRYALYAEQYASALEQGQQWIAQDSANYRAYLFTSVAAIAQGATEQALQMLRSVLELNPAGYAATYKTIGEMYLQQELSLKSLAVVEDLVQLHPELTEAWMLQVAIAQRLRNAKALIFALDKVLGIDPSNERAAVLKVTVSSSLSLVQLQEFAAQFLQKNPEARAFKIAYGRELLKRQQNELALQQLASILDTDPKDVQALNLLALIYHSMEEFENSVKYFKRHLAVRPNDDQARVYLASALHQLGRLEEAKAVVETIKGDKDRFNSYRHLALHLEKIQGADAGIAYLKTIATQNQEQTIQLIIDIGGMLAREERTAEALALLDEQVRTFPDNTLLRYQRALLFIELKDLDRHEKDMRLLLAQDPKNAHYYNTLGYSLLLTAGRLEEATKLINKAYTLQPDDPYILDSKGWLEFNLGNAERAILYLKQAFKIDPDPEIAAHIGEVYWHLGEPDKAKAIWFDAQAKEAKNATLNKTIKRFLN